MSPDAWVAVAGVLATILLAVAAGLLKLGLMLGEVKTIAHKELTHNGGSSTKDAATSAARDAKAALEEAAAARAEAEAGKTEAVAAKEEAVAARGEAAAAREASGDAYAAMTDHLGWHLRGGTP